MNNGHGHRRCPFCGERFATQTVCPVHELPLVLEGEDSAYTAPVVEADPSIDETDEDEEESDEDSSFLFDPRHGRGIVACGATALLFGFFMPFVSRVDVHTESSAWFLASSRAPNLWQVPMAAVVVFFVLATRRAPLAMRRVRLAVVLLGLLPLLSATYSLLRVLQSAKRLGERLGNAVPISIEPGAVVIVLGAVVVMAGGVLLGAPRR